MGLLLDFHLGDGCLILMMAEDRIFFFFQFQFLVGVWLGSGIYTLGCSPQLQKELLATDTWVQIVSALFKYGP